ncbi:uncharacterized protein LOC110450802 isoform X2 [Mizuhopecten yessoensis]|uniref:uncharacterized protein LOC110450802 isoform X2 n=1 Tax=Mizuhopecten yessoensis TaxID=6573 RepID=UPI000B45F899|nr:uncharacterized protein LOC110450802 isoform X2 [Mizuhopecten yessoensis]
MAGAQKVPGIFLDIRRSEVKAARGRDAQGVRNRRGSYLHTLGRRPGCKADSTNTKYLALEMGEFHNGSRFRGFAGRLNSHCIIFDAFIRQWFFNCSDGIGHVRHQMAWAHDLTGLTDPTRNVFVRNVAESARRTVKAHVKKKEPVTSQKLIKLCDIFKDCKDLLIVRDLTMILLSFVAF